MTLFDELEDIKTSLGLESENFETESDDISDIDMILSIMDIGTEGNIYTDLELSGIFSAYEDENGFVDFSDFKGFGLEAITDKISNSASKMKSLITKLANSVVSFFKRMWNIISNTDLTLTKYNKILFKLDKELGKKLFTDRNDKIEINPLEGLDDLMSYSWMLNGEEIGFSLRRLKSNENAWNHYFRWLGDDLLHFVGTGLVRKYKNTVSASVMSELANTKVIANEFDRICNVCDINKKEQVYNYEAKDKFMATYKSIQKFLKMDVKVQSKFRKYVDEVEKAMETFKTNGTLAHLEQLKDTDSINEMHSVKHIGAIMIHIQSGRTKMFKKIVSCLNRLILNIRKVINV